MLTDTQKEWVQHLSDTEKVTIIPFDTTTEEKFQILKSEIQTAIGMEHSIEHRGASNMGISGQDEIDVYIPVSLIDFGELKHKLEGLYGKPGSLYPQERARFKTSIQGKRIDVFLINKESDGWTDGVLFENYLHSNPKSLEAYKKCKEEGNGLSVKEYYTRKLIFINEILNKVKHA